MKINWFRLNNEILSRFFYESYESYESITWNSLLRLLIYLQQGYKCKDCGKDCGLCKCNYCENCKMNFCICKIQYIFSDYENEGELFISNLVKKILNVENIINIRNKLLKNGKLCFENEKIMKTFEEFGK